MLSNKRVEKFSGNRGVSDPSMKRLKKGLVGLMLGTLMVTIIATGILISGLWSFSGKSLVAGTVDPPIIKEVVVRRGDTLWSLAREHGPDKTDVRIIIDRIRHLNNLDGALLKPGMTLHIPGVS